MAKHTDMLSKAIDELLDEYEVMVKNDLGPVDAKLSDDEQGDPLAPQDNKGGLQPAGSGQGAPKDAMGEKPTSMGIEVKMPLKSASPKGDAMGADPIASADGVQKADGSVPPGFKDKDDKQSAGAEDESDEAEASDSNDSEEAPAEEGEEGSDESEGGDEGDEDSEEEGEHGFGAKQGEEQGEDGEDPEIEARVEKALYKFMAKIGMTGEMGKGDDFAKSDDLANLDPMTLEPRIKAAESLAKSETEGLRKSLGEELAKRDDQIEQLTTLVKGLSEQLNRLAKAPVARPRAVQGYAPLQKSEGDAAPINKSALIDKALGLMKAGKLHDRTLVVKMEMGSPETAAHLARQAGIE